MGTPIEPNDLTWLVMDRPTNLMHVHGLLWFEHVPDLDALRVTVEERLVRRYPTLRQHPRRRRGRWHWIDDPEFSLDRHVQTFPIEGVTEETMGHHLADRFVQPFDRSHPLWAIDLITGGPEESAGAVLLRFHHSLADGVRMVQVMLGLCDVDSDAVPKVVGMHEHHGVLYAAGEVTAKSMVGTLDLINGTVHSVGKVPRAVASTLNPLRIPRHVAKVAGAVRNPVRITDAVTSVASPANQLANSLREVSRLMFTPRDATSAKTGPLGTDKVVGWVTGLDMADIRTTRRAFGGTLNDVLLAVVSLALSAYLRERYGSHADEIGWLVPVSLRPIDANLPPKLGNHFAVVLLSMPLGVDDPRELIAEISDRTSRIKHSAEPVVAFGAQWVVGEAPSKMSRAITNFISDKSVGQLSNVPGPRTKVSLSGKPVEAMVGWVPTTGRQALGLCIFSYNDHLSIGLNGDAMLVPDPARVGELVKAAMADLVTRALAEAAR